MRAADGDRVRAGRTVGQTAVTIAGAAPVIILLSAATWAAGFAALEAARAVRRAAGRAAARRRERKFEREVALLSAEYLPDVHATWRAR